MTIETNQHSNPFWTPMTIPCNPSSSATLTEEELRDALADVTMDILSGRLVLPYVILDPRHVANLNLVPGAMEGRQGGGDGILEGAMPVNIGYVVGDVNYATQGSNITTRSPSSGLLTQTTAGVAKPNPLTLVWQSVRKAWSAIAAANGWWPAIKARLGFGR